MFRVPAYYRSFAGAGRGHPLKNRKLGILPYLLLVTTHPGRSGYVYSP